MQQLLIQANSKNTADAIKTFVKKFDDATIESESNDEESYYQQTYGISKKTFESRINTGIAKSILGMTKPWSEVKEGLLKKISSK